jgi:hypothetical protein
VVRRLVVGKSPPANGTFFYKADSQVFRYMLEAFSKLGGPEIGGDEFLTRFKSLGCYLDDLVLKPINNTIRTERKRARKEWRAWPLEYGTHRPWPW